MFVFNSALARSAGAREPQIIGLRARLSRATFRPFVRVGIPMLASAYPCWPVFCAGRRRRLENGQYVFMGGGDVVDRAQFGRAGPFGYPSVPVRACTLPHRVVPGL